MEVRSFRLGYSRKDGRSNYGNEGGSLELCCDLGEGEDPGPAIVAAAALARRHVQQLLQQHQADDDETAAAVAAPAPPPAHPTAATASTAAAATAARRAWAPKVPAPKRNATSNSSRRGSAGGGSNGYPKCGAELFPWAKRLEEQEGQEGLIKQIKAWGAERNLPWKLTDWPAEYVEALVLELRDLVTQTA